MFGFQPGTIPWGEGLTVFVTGFGGVFLALLLLYGGMKLTSLVAGRLESAEKDEKKSS